MHFLVNNKKKSFHNQDNIGVTPFQSCHVYLYLLWTLSKIKIKIKEDKMTFPPI